MKVISFAVTVLATVSLASDICWRDSFKAPTGVRGLWTCPAGMEKSGLLCYPKCKNGYYGVGPVCWSYCPEGWRDDGALCNNRGGWTAAADNSKCPWYDICGLTFSRGCSNCDKYPGTSNHGCTCHKWMKVIAKKTYGRGIGKPLTCGRDEVQDGLLCYPKKCKDKAGKKFEVKDVSLFSTMKCWEKCTGATPVDCGAICAKDSAACQKWNSGLKVSGITAAAGAVASFLTAGALLPIAITATMGIGGATIDLDNPMCGTENMLPYAAGRCRANTNGRFGVISTFRGVLLTECLNECSTLDACTHAQYEPAKDTCILYDDCSENDDAKGYEIFVKSDKAAGLPTPAPASPDHVMADHGRGYCTSGYVRGWDRKGVESPEACMAVCMAEADCTYAAFYEGQTCSRYNGSGCTLNEDPNHFTFKKITNPKKE